MLVLHNKLICLHKNCLENMTQIVLPSWLVLLRGIVQPLSLTMPQNVTRPLPPLSFCFVVEPVLFCLLPISSLTATTWVHPLPTPLPVAILSDNCSPLFIQTGKSAEIIPYFISVVIWDQVSSSRFRSDKLCRTVD
jgi:hypothetical protein